MENAGKCDLLIGDWIHNPKGPLYTNESCKWIEGHQNCMKNGRPDTGYLYWRWKPRDCELPQLNPERFLELMRNKAWALIGDSITRNHIQSLICILSKVKYCSYHERNYYIESCLCQFLYLILLEERGRFQNPSLFLCVFSG